jgi:hypothetical protein
MVDNECYQDILKSFDQLSLSQQQLTYHIENKDILSVIHFLKQRISVHRASLIYLIFGKKDKHMIVCYLISARARVDSMNNFPDVSPICSR